MIRVAFAGVFAARLEEPVRARLAIPCDVVVGDESKIVPRLPEVGVPASMAFAREMGASARRPRLVQVLRASLGRIDQSAVPAGTWLANAYGREVGIAQYAAGAQSRSGHRALPAQETRPGEPRGGRERIPGMAGGSHDRAESHKTDREEPESRAVRHDAQKYGSPASLTHIFQ